MVQYGAKLCELLETHTKAFLVHADNVGSKQMMDIRAVSGGEGMCVGREWEGCCWLLCFVGVLGLVLAPRAGPLRSCPTLLCAPLPLSSPPGRACAGTRRC